METTRNSTPGAVPHAGAESPALEKEQIQACKGWVMQLEKTLKSLQLYKTNHEISKRMEIALTQQMAAYLEAWGRTGLAIRATEILLEENSVYLREKAAGSLSFLFFRDGIRKITFLPGLTREEIHDFLFCLKQMSGKANEHGDLVTMFWECNFHFIRYVALDTLHPDRAASRVSDQLASATVQAPEVEVSVAAIEQPAAHVPTEECHLTEEELDGICAQLVGENERNSMESILMLAAELITMEPSEEERLNIIDVLVRTIELQLAEKLVVTRRALLQFFQVTVGAEDLERLQVLTGAVRSSLSKPKNVDALLADMPGPDVIPPALLEEYLRCLEPAAALALLRHLTELENPDHRRTVSDAVASFGAAAREAMTAFVRGLSSPIPSVLIHELLHIAVKLGPISSAPVLRELIKRSDEQTRLTLALSLDRYQPGPTGEAWRSLLRDPSAKVRSAMLKMTERSGHPDLVPDLRAMAEAPDFSQQAIDNKRRVFTAAARLASDDENITWLSGQVQPAKRRWFAKQRDRETSMAAALALASMRRDGAGRALGQLMKTGDRVARSVCRELSKRSVIKT